MIKQPYSYWLIVLEGAGWDMKEFLESNLHMYGRDDTKIVVYNMGRCTKKGDRKKSSNFEQNCELLYNIIKKEDNII